MKYFLPTGLLVGLLLASDLSAFAQSNCAVTLRAARATYDQGRLHELTSLLQECLQSGFTRQEKVEAYKLLALAYIYLEEPQKADEAMLQLLETDPYFQINKEADPAEFIALYNTFRTWPVYRMGAKVGVNGTLPTVVSQISAVEGSAVEYTPTINFQAGLVFEIPFNERLTLNPEAYFQIRSFYYDSDLDLENDLENTSEGKESENWISLPVSLQYRIGSSKLNPYVSAGLSVDYLTYAQFNISRFRVNATSTPERTVDITSSRNRWNFSAIASTGIKMKLGVGYVIAEMRFIYGIKKINDPSTAFTIDQYLLFDHAYADNEIRINSLCFTAGYIYNVFNPKKLRVKK